MLYRFGDYELDTPRAELRCDGAAVPVEPQVLTLLTLLAENHDRVVTKDEIIDIVWGGRAISDAAVDSRIRSARQAVGDDGQAQQVIRTIRGRGFRFCAPMKAMPQADAGTAFVPPTPRGPEESLAPQKAGVQSGRPSIAILPFRTLGADEAHTPIATALPHDLIAALSRLRWLFVISRASTFRFHGDALDPLDATRMLGARYCLSGMVESAGTELWVSVELADAVDGRIVWADRLRGPMHDIYALRTRIVAEIVAALELRIPAEEADRASLSAPDNLDAWSLYHLGLRHMFRFTRADNASAQRLFEQAIRLEPGFARAHGGMAFTHFQNAFIHYPGDAENERRRTRECAARAIELDPMDPFASYNMGRAHWLDHDLDGARHWMDRCTTLNPNHAQGIYLGGCWIRCGGKQTARRPNWILPMR